MSQSFFTFKISARFLIIGALGLGIAGGAFFVRSKGTNPKAQQEERARIAHAAVSDTIDNGIFKSLEQLSADAADLDRAVQHLQSDVSPESYNTVVSAWESAYRSWMLCVAFQFGPCTQYDHHKRLATWPCDKVLIDHALEKMAAGELELSARYLREEEFSQQRGFFTLQYLLFRGGLPRSAADLSAAELDYLAAAAQCLHEESINFEASWIGTTNLPAAKQAFLAACGFKTKPSYAEEFRNPGTPSSRYASISSTLQEICLDLSGVIEGSLPLLAELPDAPAPGEAAYWNPIDPYGDLVNWIQGFENAYLGGVDGFRAAGMSDFVAVHDSALDRLIKISIVHTTYRIEELRASRGKSEQERELAFRIAEAELEKLGSRINSAIPQVILDPVTEPFAAYVN